MSALKDRNLEELRESLEEADRAIAKGSTVYECFCAHDAKEAINVGYELLRRLADISALIHGEDLIEEGFGDEP